MINPSQEVVRLLRESYPEGTRVALVHMGADPYSKFKEGNRGTVRCVDDIGTIHVNWDCGSGLGIAYGEDSCRKLTKAELAEEQKKAEEPDIEESGTKMSM